MVRFLWKYVRQDLSALLINIFFVFLQIERDEKYH